MSHPSIGFKWGTIVWSALIAIGLIALAGGILLPSTKSGKIDLDEFRRGQEQAEAAAAAALATTMPASTQHEASQPTTQP